MKRHSTRLIGKKDITTSTEETHTTATAKKRKRGGHNSACWVCQRDHRACDASRPCKRCVSIGTGDDCVRPPPNKTERPKRRKFFVVTTESFSGCGSSSSASTRTETITTTETLSQRTRFTEPIRVNNSSFSGWQWQQQGPSPGSESPLEPPSDGAIPENLRSPPPTLPIGLVPSVLPAPVGIPPAISPQAPELPDLMVDTEKEKEKEQLLLALLKEVQQLNQTTGRLKDEQSMLGKQISVLQQKQDKDCSHDSVDAGRPTNGKHSLHLDPSLLDSGTCPTYVSQPPSRVEPLPSSAIWRNRSGNNRPQIIHRSFVNVNEQSFENVFETQVDVEFSRSSSSSSHSARPLAAMPRDCLRFAENFFLPPGLEDNRGGMDTPELGMCAPPLFLC